jgi:hypothetical protein
LGELGGDPAERTAERRRPLEPDPDNAGGGKTVKIEENSFATREFSSLKVLEAYLNG